MERQMIIEGSEDRYREGTPECKAWYLGREAFMANSYANVKEAEENCPKWISASERLKKAWLDGVEDERLHGLDSTGR
jgi:hypothetical protein